MVKMSRLLKFDYKEGTKIYFELHNGHQFEGTFIDSDNFRMRVSNICQLPGKNILSGQSQFFKKEILIIRQTDREDTCEAEVLTETSTCLDSDIIKYWTENSQIWTYISVLNEDFEECIEKMECYDTIAVNGIGNEGRKHKICLLAIATKFDMYVIDIEQCPSAFQRGLKRIFQSKDICKVVYNSALLTDCLYHLHKVELCNFFDLKVADKIISKDRNTFRSLSDLLVDFGQLSRENAQVVDNILVDSNIDKAILKQCILSVTYMIPLKFLFEKMMLKGFYAKCDYCVTRTRDKSPISSLVTPKQLFEELEKLDIKDYLQ